MGFTLQFQLFYDHQSVIRREGGEETAAAVARAIKVAVAANAKIINMSFGEPASRSTGFLRRVIDDAVLRYGVTFLASAGNAGPALQVDAPYTFAITLRDTSQTVGAPGGTFSSVIGVAAHVGKSTTHASIRLTSLFPFDSGHIRHECRSLPAIGSTPLPLHMVVSGAKLRGRGWSQYISPRSCHYLRALPPTLLQLIFSDASFRFQFGPETPSS